MMGNHHCHSATIMVTVGCVVVDGGSVCVAGGIYNMW